MGGPSRIVPRDFPRVGRLAHAEQRANRRLRRRLGHYSDAVNDFRHPDDVAALAFLAVQSRHLINRLRVARGRLPHGTAT